jgi:peptide/nickel transport system ATP-binding protein
MLLQREDQRMNDIIEIKNLKKYFSTPRGMLHAVDDVSLSISRGHTLGVVGESGCGKSTLGRTILRMIEPTSGAILFNGVDIVSRSKKELHLLRRDMQMIFQDPYDSLDPRMNVRDLIAESLLINKLGISKEGMLKIVHEMMDLVGIPNKLEGSYPHELDGGSRQRVGIARALALNPKFIVCDEPVSALDVSIQAQILNLLQDLQDEKNLTYLFITHNLSVVRHIAERICVMYLGQAVEIADKQELFGNPVHPYTQALLSAIPVPSTHNRKQRIILKGELTSPVAPKPGCRFAARCRYAKPICFEETPALKAVGTNHAAACHETRARPG